MKTTSRNVSKVSDRTVVNDLAGKVFSGSHRRLPIIIAFLYYILKFFLSVGAFTPRAILRSKIGERTIGVITVLMVYAFFFTVHIGYHSFIQAKEFLIKEVRVNKLSELSKEQLYDLFVIVVTASSTDEFHRDGKALAPLALGLGLKKSILAFQGLSWPLKVCWWLVLLMSLLHFIEIIYRRRQGEVLHSYHRGKSVFFSWMIGKKIPGGKVNELMVWMIVEPLFVLSIAFLLNRFLQFEVLGLVLIISAICLFMEEYRAYLDNRSMLLDIVDSQIDARVISEIQGDYSERIDRDNPISNNENINTVMTD
jgi:hypothetical protein